MIRLLSVCGARPNFVKIAPLMAEFARRPAITARLVHTGQHYDPAMNDQFFSELRIPRPDIALEVGSASHAVQTARIMERFEPVLLAERPDALLVVGDVNSTMACALVAAKLHVPVIHVEAGLRSFDRTMPEEINRIVTDSISDFLFATERSGLDNLVREGIDRNRVRLVGNVMIDTLRQHLAAAAGSQVLESLALTPANYAVLTLHRPTNVDRPASFARIVDALAEIQQTCPVVFPVHPRTRARIEDSEVGRRIARLPGIRLCEPLGYLDFLKLMSHASVVLTDSGGVQEETTVLAVPCLTLRENTERPATIDEGTNRLVGDDPERILQGFRDARSAPPSRRTPELWDGHASHRIADAILERYAS